MKPNLPRRKPTRLRDYDYSQPGAYFVTICVQHRKCLFGTIVDGQMQLNEIGKIVVECWNHIPQHFPFIELGDSVIMPNHIHGIIVYPLVGGFCLGVSAGSPRPTAEQQSKHTTVEVGSPRPSEGAQSTHPIVGAGSPHPPKNPSALGKIVAYFKYQSTKHINQHRNIPGTRIWQRNYHDHIIRDDADLQRLRQYIQDNPMKWELDQLHPDNPSKW